MRARRTFKEVLTEAVRDFERNGFDSQDRLDFWIKELEESIKDFLKSGKDFTALVSRSLSAIYRRMVEGHSVFTRMSGISRFTLDRIKPELRRELSARIAASANLIKLNRERAISDTLRRFSGWASSVPVGGSKAVEKSEVKQVVRKALAGLPFVERRVLIDQGHKFTASVNSTVAIGGGALAAEWKSNWRQGGYNYRKDHKERDGHIYLIRGSWAEKAGLVKPGDAGYSDEITQPAEEVYCRCHFKFVFSLRKLPDNMLTAKGRESLKSTNL